MAEFLEEAVLSDVKQAIEQAKDLSQSEMTKITGGLGMAGLCRRFGGHRPPLQSHVNAATRHGGQAVATTLTERRCYNLLHRARRWS